MKRVRFLSAVLVAVAGVAALPAQAAEFVILAKGQGRGSTAFVKSLGSAVVANLEDMGIVLARSDDPAFAARVEKMAGVQAVARDREIQWLPQDRVAADDLGATAFAANGDPFIPMQWNLTAIGADRTAAAGYLGAGARVAVLDSGIVANHPDLVARVNVALSASFVPGEGVVPPPTTFNHGTHVAGIIAASINGIGTQGVAPEAEIVAVKVLRASGSGSFSWLIYGLDYASGPAVRADVANMSLGATFDRTCGGLPCGDDGKLIAALTRALNIATQRGTLLVASAGNDGVDLNTRLMTIPAQLGTTMAVAATGPVGWAIDPTTSLDVAATYTNYGQSVVDVAAPGGNDVLWGATGNCTVGSRTRPCYVFDLVFAPSGYSDAGYFYSWAEGTSMAAPHVSGLAALLVGRYGHVGPARLREMIENSAVDILAPGADPFSGKGRIDAAKALGL